MSTGSTNHTRFAAARMDIGEFIGIEFTIAEPLTIADMLADWWQITCPCGIKVTFPINGLPTVDTPMPCGNPRHWAVRFKEQK